MPSYPISVTTARIQYTATGGQTVFPYNFPIFDEDHLVVQRTRSGTVTTLALTTDYTVSGVDVETGGNVTLVTGATAGDIITIYRSVPLQRLTDYQTAGDFEADTVNMDFDLLWMAQQDSARDGNRSLRLQVSDSTDPDDFVVPLTADRASMYLGFDVDGLPIPVAAAVGSAVVTPFMETVLDDTDAATARATLGALGSGAVTGGDLTMATGKLLGRTTASTGAIEEITPSSGLTLAAGALTVDAATTSAAGKIEIATQAEVNAMTDPSRAMVPNHNRIVNSGKTATTSGTAIDFTGIPAGVRRITVSFAGVSTGSTSNLLVRIGTSSGIEATGYDTAANGTGQASSVTSSTGFIITQTLSASDAVRGQVVLTLVDPSDFSWVGAGTVWQGSASGSVCRSAGGKSLAAELDRVRITSVSGDTFDAGAISISYER